MYKMRGLAVFTVIIAFGVFTLSRGNKADDESPLADSMQKNPSVDIYESVKRIYEQKTRDPSQDDVEVCIFYGMKCPKDRGFCDPVTQRCKEIFDPERSQGEKEEICLGLHDEGKLQNDFGHRTVCHYITSQAAFSREKLWLQQMSKTDPGADDCLCSYNGQKCKQDTQFCDTKSRKCVKGPFGKKSIKEKEKKCQELARKGTLETVHGAKQVCYHILAEQALRGDLSSPKTEADCSNYLVATCVPAALLLLLGLGILGYREGLHREVINRCCRPHDNTHVFNNRDGREGSERNRKKEQDPPGDDANQEDMPPVDNRRGRSSNPPNDEGIPLTGGASSDDHDNVRVQE